MSPLSVSLSRFRISAFLLSLGFFLNAAVTAGAALVFTHLTLTPTSFSVEISGTLPAAYPKNSLATLYFVNPEASASPGYALQDFAMADAQSILGSGQNSRFGTGGSLWGDYAIVNFSRLLAAGETLSGTLSGTWNSAVFDVSKVSSLNVFWGSDEDQGHTAAAITGGIPLGIQVPVNPAPEPGIPMLAGLGSAGVCLLWRRRADGRHVC